VPPVKAEVDQHWCPCCEQLFVAGSAEPPHRLSAAHLARRSVWQIQAVEQRVARQAQRQAETAAGLLCPDCGRREGQHVFRCRILRLAEPCGLCGRPFDRSLQSPHPDAITRDHWVPQVYIRAHGLNSGVRGQNIVPTHQRCNTWKSDHLPRDIAALQPPWGIFPDRLKVKASRLPRATREEVRRPWRVPRPSRGLSFAAAG
jgi:5-methylcytosine-specific restriction endonuclease McrA